MGKPRFRECPGVLATRVFPNLGPGCSSDRGMYSRDLVLPWTWVQPRVPRTRAYPGLEPAVDPFARRSASSARRTSKSVVSRVASTTPSRILSRSRRHGKKIILQSAVRHEFQGNPGRTGATGPLGPALFNVETPPRARTRMLASPRRGFRPSKSRSEGVRLPPCGRD